jgi:hypothetical protein
MLQRTSLVLAPVTMMWMMSLGASGTAKTARTQEGGWPAIQSIEESRTFSDLAKASSDAPFVVSVKNVDGAVAYELECRTSGRQDASGRTVLDQFRCALYPAGDRGKAADLLIDSTASRRRGDWLQRGRMVPRHLREACSLSSYGTVRVFRLRGMRMNLRFSNLRWVETREPTLSAFTVNVSVAPERNAASPISEAVKLPKWLVDSCL